MNMMMSEEELAALPPLERAQAKLYMLRIASQTAAAPAPEASESKPLPVPPAAPPPAVIQPPPPGFQAPGMVSLGEVVAAFSAITSGAIERAVKSAIEAGVSSALTYAGGLTQQNVQAQLSLQADSVARGEPAGSPLLPPSPVAASGNSQESPILPAVDPSILTGSAALRSGRKTYFPPSPVVLGTPQTPADVARALIGSMKPEVRSIIRCLCIGGNNSTRAELNQLAGAPIDWRRYIVTINSTYKRLNEKGLGLLSVIGSPEGTEFDIFQTDQGMLVEFARELSELSGETVVVGDAKPVDRLFPGPDEGRQSPEPAASGPKASEFIPGPGKSSQSERQGAAVVAPVVLEHDAAPKGSPSKAPPKKDPVSAKTPVVEQPAIKASAPKTAKAPSQPPAGVSPPPAAEETPAPVRKKPGPKPGFKKAQVPPQNVAPPQPAPKAAATAPTPEPEASSPSPAAPKLDSKPAAGATPASPPKIESKPAPASPAPAPSPAPKAPPPAKSESVQAPKEAAPGPVSTVSVLTPKAGVAAKPAETPRRPAPQLFPPKDLLMVDLPEVEDQSILPQPGGRWGGLD